MLALTLNTPENETESKMFILLVKLTEVVLEHNEIYYCLLVFLLNYQVIVCVEFQDWQITNELKNVTLGIFCL